MEGRITEIATVKKRVDFGNRGFWMDDSVKGKEDEVMAAQR